MRSQAVLFVFALLIGAYGRAAPPTPDEAGLPLTAVIRREQVTLAVNKAGLFLAQNDERQWRRLETPPEMPSEGTFASVPAGSKRIVYCSHGGARPRPKPYVDGIYLSEDEGVSWSLLWANDSLGSVFLHPNGSLFAASNRGHSPFPAQIQVSQDMGKTWRDITGKGVGGIVRIFRDPDHPDLVCLSTSGPPRGYILQAEDATYQWASHFEWEWYRKHPSPFFQEHCSTTTALYMLPASLSNYFQHDFGDRTMRCAFQIVPDSMKLEFDRGSRVVVPIALRFDENEEVNRHFWQERRAAGYPDKPPEPTVVKLIDQTDTTALWGLKAEHQGEQVFHRAALAEASQRSRDREATQVRVRAEGKWEVISLSEANPYRRTLDLTTMHDFSAPGDYRLQIVYANDWLTRKDSGEWGGTFASPVMSVRIK